MKGLYRTGSLVLGRSWWLFLSDHHWVSLSDEWHQGAEQVLVLENEEWVQ